VRKIIKLQKYVLNFSGLFIIDDKGILRQITVNDLPVGRSVDETLRLVQAFQFTDKHGEGMLIYFTYLIFAFLCTSCVLYLSPPQRLLT
jgi:alkyl hydroperoxide reductase subunit AhpC